MVAARGAAVVVAMVAGAASFEHIASVARAAGERLWVAYSLPLAIDGLIVVGVAALLVDKRGGRRGRFSARLAVLVGVTATLAANVASAEPTWTARPVAVAAPVSFLLSVEVLTRTGRRRADATAASSDRSASTAVGQKVAGPVSADGAVPVRRRRSGRRRTTPAVDRTGPAARGRTSDRHGVGRTGTMDHDGAEVDRSGVHGSADRSGDGGLAEVARAVHAELAGAGQRLTRQRLATALRGRGHTVSNAHAGELLASLRADAGS